MSTSIGPSSSLNILERYNDSRSTVSSSDTDLSSAGYASSSGTTTPEDDTQTFYLGPTLQNVLADNSKHAPAEKLSIVTKPRNFSLAMKKMKKVAHALVVFKRKRPDDISPILISSPLRERFGKRMSVRHNPDKSFYSLPNRRFSLSDVSASSGEEHSATITRKFGTISGSSFVSGMPRRGRGGPRMPSFSGSSSSALPSPTSTTEAPQAERGTLTFSAICIHVLRILLFVPWCAAVGGALLLFPSHVEIVAFRTGYLPSPKGIRRFAHWAECGQQHIAIFLACLVAVVWYNRALGLSVAGVVATRFAFVWGAFEVDWRIPLGEDDQQSLYLVMTGLASRDGSFRVSGPRGGRTGCDDDV